MAAHAANHFTSLHPRGPVQIFLYFNPILAARACRISPYMLSSIKVIIIVNSICICEKMFVLGEGRERLAGNFRRQNWIEIEKNLNRAPGM